MKRIALNLMAILFLLAGNAWAEFQAGISVRVVTPDPLLPVSGGVGPSSPTEKALGELTVRALVLANEETTIAIVSTDFLGFPSTLCERVRAQVENIPPENIMIGASHTHSAPDLYGFPNEAGDFAIDLDYVDWVCRQTVEAIHEAAEKRQPASVKIAMGEVKGKVAYNYYAPQLYDPRASVLQCLDENQEPIATLVNYAIHPEVLGNDQGILSPDMVGPLYDRIREQGGGVGIFMNSALGGMVTADVRGPDGNDVQTWEECIRIGRRLADESLRIVAEAPVQNDPALFCAGIPLTLPIDSPMLLQVVKLSPLHYDIHADNSLTTQLNVVNVGNAQMLTIPGEAMPNIGYYLKRKMHGEHNFLLGLTNDALGYILTKEDFNSFQRYDYISRTSLGEFTGEIFIEEALAFVNRCPRPVQ